MLEIKKSELEKLLNLRNNLTDFILKDENPEVMENLNNFLELSPKLQLLPEIEIHQRLVHFDYALIGLEKHEEKINLFDQLIFKYILLKLFKNQSNIFSFHGILKNKTEPNYNILSKIYLDLEKIKYENILNLIFGKEDEIFKTVLFAEYLIQRKIDFKSLIINLLKTRFVMWCEIYEPKSREWYTDLFNLNESIPEQFQNMNIFDEIYRD